MFLADGGRLRGQAVRVRGTGGGRSEFGESEIKNLGVAAVGYENICRLNVPVDDAFGMGCVKRVSDLDAQRQEVVQFQRPVADHVLERGAVQKFHHQERLPILFTDVVYGADVWMV